MLQSTPDQELIEFMDLISETLSNGFVERWRFRFSPKFIKLFQFKLLDTLRGKRPLKKNSLFLYLHKRNNYSREQVNSFFEA